MLNPRNDFLPILLAVFAFVRVLHADPLLEAEAAFLRELNAMPGLELMGGPFRANERSNFGEAGYFVITPSLTIPSLDQRLSVQTKRADLTKRALPAEPLAPSSYATSGDFTPADRRAIHELLAEFSYGAPRDEITLLDDGSLQIRPVHHLSLIKLTRAETNDCVALLGAQMWQGIPLYRASFDRARGTFDLEILRENFVPKRLHELRERPFPMHAPQTFFADAGLEPEHWRKVLRNFARLDLPALQILDAKLNETHVTLRADLQFPVLPQSWVRFRQEGSQWKLHQAVDFRSEFPRPAPWWTFLPLLPATDFLDRFESSAVPRDSRAALGPIVQSLRGVGPIASFTPLPKEAVRVTTTHNGWRGYHLDFAKIQDRWRMTAMSEWTD